MQRKLESVEEIKNIIAKYSEESIVIDEHCKKQIKREDRDISEILIIEVLVSGKIYFAEKQIIRGEVRYKLASELSRKYDLVIVVTESEKCLKVITSYKTSKKVRTKWQKQAKLAMKKD
jgi:hypothetical protein